MVNESVAIKARRAQSSTPRDRSPEGIAGSIARAEYPDSLFESHLLFDHVLPPSEVGNRECYEAMARSVRDLLSHHWQRTDQTYRRENPKRVYYLSMEFLIGRSLSNNIVNLQLDPVAAKLFTRHQLDKAAILEEEPDAGLGNGGLGRLAACFLDSMATMQLPALGYGLRYEYGMFKQSIVDGWQREQPDNWLRRPDPWEVARPGEALEIRLGCSFEIRGGSLRAIEGIPSSLIGIPHDRPIVGYGGKTINTLRLWASATPDNFDFQEFSGGDFVDALAERLTAETVTRVLYPDDSTAEGRGLRFVQEYFLVACSLADLIRRFRSDNSDWHSLPDKVAIQLNDTHPSLAVAELMRILLDEAALEWETAWSLAKRTLAYTNHTLLPEALKALPGHLRRMRDQARGMCRVKQMEWASRQHSRSDARRELPVTTMSDRACSNSSNKVRKPPWLRFRPQGTHQRQRATGWLASRYRQRNSSASTPTGGRRIIFRSDKSTFSTILCSGNR